MTSNFITILGTGNAHATQCYNTCFTIHSGGAVMLVDAGGGNGILTQLERAGIGLGDFHDLFLTHAHTDHFLGAVWIVRMALEYHQRLRVWSHSKVIGLLTNICTQILPKNAVDNIGKSVTMHTLEDGDRFDVGGIKIQCFDIHSKKEIQYGFNALFADGTRLCCLGDEPFNPLCAQYAEGVDWLMSEAFCTYDDRKIFLPYEKSHSTALDAAVTAEQLRVKNLILYHTEDRTFATRRQKYTAEASAHFSGKVIVPNDLEKIML